MPQRNQRDCSRYPNAQKQLHQYQARQGAAIVKGTVSGILPPPNVGSVVGGVSVGGTLQALGGLAGKALTRAGIIGSEAINAGFWLVASYVKNSDWGAESEMQTNAFLSESGSQMYNPYDGTSGAPGCGGGG